MQNTKAHFQDLSFGQVENGVVMNQNNLKGLRKDEEITSVEDLTDSYDSFFEIILMIKLNL